MMTFGVSTGAKMCFMSERDNVIYKTRGVIRMVWMKDDGGHVNLHFIFVDLGVN